MKDDIMSEAPDDTLRRLRAGDESLLIINRRWHWSRRGWQVFWTDETSGRIRHEHRGRGPGWDAQVRKAASCGTRPEPISDSVAAAIQARDVQTAQVLTGLHAGQVLRLGVNHRHGEVIPADSMLCSTADRKALLYVCWSFHDWWSAGLPPQVYLTQKDLDQGIAIIMNQLDARSDADAGLQELRSAPDGLDRLQSLRSDPEALLAAFESGRALFTFRDGSRSPTSLEALAKYLPWAILRINTQ